MILHVFYKTAFKFLILLPIALVGSFTFAADGCGKKPLKIAILDTGLDLNDPRFSEHICDGGHWNFVMENLNLTDEYDHGTHVAGLIQQHAGKGNYCFLIYKYYSDANPGSLNLKNTIKAIKAAVKNGANIINYSGGGPEFSEDEYLAIKNNPKVTFIVAAGNEHHDIDTLKDYYPACYKLPNEIIVGSNDKFGNRAPTSNSGSHTINAWEIGDMVQSTLPNGKMGWMGGTSQATAVHTGKVVANRLHACNSAK